MADTTSRFIENYENKYSINTTPSGSEETWSPLAKGISNVSWGGNEVTDQTVYYDGEGMGSTEVTGGQLVLSVSGHRVVGDAAQDYVYALFTSYGSARHTDCKIETPEGKTYTGDVTIANIENAAGDANAKDEISFELHFNGKPTETTTTTAG